MLCLGHVRWIVEMGKVVITTCKRLNHKTTPEDCKNRSNDGWKLHLEDSCNHVSSDETWKLHKSITEMEKYLETAE